MTRIAPVAQPIFGSNSSNNGQFGSAVLGTKITSLDPSVIMELPAWETGWSAATVTGQKLPTLEEMQGTMYVATYQIAYLLQEGVPEYNEDTTYFENSIVKETGTYVLYGSLIDDNIGEDLDDPTKWQTLVDLDFSNRSISAADADATPSVAGLKNRDGIIILATAASPFDITGFDDGGDGQRISFLNLGASTATIKAGANFRLISGTDKAVATNSIVDLIFDGTKWNQVSAVVAIS